MLPFFALPLMLGATNAGLTVATDVVFGLYNAMQGRMGGLNDSLDGFLGGNNDTFVGCVSEGVVHGVISSFSVFTAPIKSVYNGVRGLGEFAHGDYIDAAIHTITALTGFSCVTNLASKIVDASGTAAKTQVAKKGLKTIVKESGYASGAFFTKFIDPWIRYFKAGAKNSGGVVDKLMQQHPDAYLGMASQMA